ncbi:MAG: hypothetical protein NTY38_02150 [Acidobacteria bacterium]|nr:hypothetical protein [Acidobacteriota bacterium]
MNMIWRLAMVGAVVAASSMASSGITIAKDGQAACTIVVRPDAIESEKYAASELALWLGKVTGGEFRIVEGSRRPDGSVILVGGGPAAAAAFPGAPLDQLGDEEVLIEAKGDTLLLAGGRPRGTLYAVYRFLSGNLGIRWWAPWATDVPARRSLQVGAIHLREKPASPGIPSGSRPLTVTGQRGTAPTASMLTWSRGTAARFSTRALCTRSSRWCRRRSTLRLIPSGTA